MISGTHEFLFSNFRYQVKPTYHIFARDIIELQNSYSGQQNIQLQLICGLLVAYLLNFFLGRWAHICCQGLYLSCAGFKRKCLTASFAFGGGVLGRKFSISLPYALFYFFDLVLLFSLFSIFGTLDHISFTLGFVTMQPLFPGESGVDQLVEIIKVWGVMWCYMFGW